LVQVVQPMTPAFDGAITQMLEQVVQPMKPTFEGAIIQMSEQALQPMPPAFDVAITQPLEPMSPASDRPNLGFSLCTLSATKQVQPHHKILR
jgi:hypothetical protein